MTKITKDARNAFLDELQSKASKHDALAQSARYADREIDAQYDAGLAQGYRLAFGELASLLNGSAVLAKKKVTEAADSLREDAEPEDAKAQSSRYANRERDAQYYTGIAQALRLSALNLEARLLRGESAPRSVATSTTSEIPRQFSRDELSIDEIFID